MAIISLLFSMGEAYYVLRILLNHISPVLFHFILGRSLLATASIVLAMRANHYALF